MFDQSGLDIDKLRVHVADRGGVADYHQAGEAEARDAESKYASQQAALRALRAEVIELKAKPSVPLGERGEDAFGGRADFPERGERLRALLNLGREDVDVAGLRPLDPRLGVMGASSDYLIVDATEAAETLRVGDAVSFRLGYGALLAAMDSQYVEKQLVDEAP